MRCIDDDTFFITVRGLEMYASSRRMFLFFSLPKIEDKNENPEILGYCTTPGKLGRTAAVF